MKLLDTCAFLVIPEETSRASIDSYKISCSDESFHNKACARNGLGFTLHEDIFKSCIAAIWGHGRAPSLQASEQGSWYESIWKARFKQLVHLKRRSLHLWPIELQPLACPWALRTSTYNIRICPCTDFWGHQTPKAFHWAFIKSPEEQSWPQPCKALPLAPICHRTEYAWGLALLQRRAVRAAIYSSGEIWLREKFKILVKHGKSLQ